MLINNMMQNLNSNLNRMERYQRQIASGRKFERPSEDPIGMSKSLKLYTDVSKTEQYERNLRDATSWMHSTENAFIELGEILQRTRELCVDAANGPKTPEDTQKISEEIKQLREQIIKLANSRHAGRSIFTGFKTDKDLLDKDGNYIIDLNSTDTSIYNVGISESIEVNTVGIKVFGVLSNSKIKSDNLDMIKGKLTEAGITINGDPKTLAELAISVDASAFNKVVNELNNSGIEIVGTQTTLAGLVDNITLPSVPDDKLGELKTSLKNSGITIKEDSTTLRELVDSMNPPNFDAFKSSLKEVGVSVQGDPKTLTELVDNFALSNDYDVIKSELESANIKTGDATNFGELWNNMIEEYGEVDITDLGFSKDKVQVDDISTEGNDESSKSALVQVFDNLIKNLEKGEHEKISSMIEDVDKVKESVLAIRAEIGAKTNRLEMTENRLSSEKLNFKKVLSLNEDVDEAEVIMEAKMAEAVYNASLAVGSKIIQPTLVDFLR
ncbi:flagellar hook-associated protein 3 [Gottschalkia acidurici 9a]|uniref:Flagellar hook-associated protein 3 n=2 Tax=Clostridium acidurici TaxID=1556 RepID=K0AU06_GOTA9|nr:flagellar hook-associated protein 3 [Gottschalkia acidurici 9a]